MQTNSYDPTMAEGVELLPYPTEDQQRWIEEAKKDTGDVAINPKMGGACKKCGGILIDNSCQSCGATQKQETQESYTIDKKAHRGAQKAAKIRNLAKGATNAGEKAAAEKKAKGPKLFGERALTKGEEDEKEKNVKGMKKSFSDFKKRYGDDAKSVMYATATKMAKEETEIDEATYPSDFRNPDGSKRAVAKKKYGRPQQHDQKTDKYGRRKTVDEDTELDERTRYAKETGKDFKTGNPSEKGGKEPSPAMKSTKDFMRKTGGAMSARGKAIAIRGKKKDKGAKPKFKSGPTPVDKIKGQLAKKRAPKPSIGSRFD